MNKLKLFIIFATIGSAFAGSSSLCEPLSSNFIQFENVWLKFVEDFLNYSTTYSLLYPNLAPGILIELTCDASHSVDIASNVTSTLSGVSYELAKNIFTGNLTPPFEAPLDCITKDLMFMKAQYVKVINGIIPRLEETLPNITANYDSCLGAQMALVPYLEDLREGVVGRVELVLKSSNSFASVGVDELFIQDFRSLDKCTWKTVSVDIGAILGVDYLPLLDYFEGKTEMLPYPFDCIKDLVDLIKNYFITKLDDILNGRDLNFEPIY